MLKNSLLVIFGNCLLLFSKILVGFVIPGILGITEYGYYKTYTLYMGYAMLLHFGFPDGILLIFAGREYEKLEKKEFRMYSKFLFLFLGGISVIGFLVCMCYMQGMTRFIFCMLSIETFFMNYATYLKFISQAVMRFKELTFRNTIEAALRVVSIIILVILTKVQLIEFNSKIYITLLIIIDAFLLIWYVRQYQDLIFGESVSLQWKKLGDIIKTGIILTVTAQVASLVFNLDCQLVVLLFDIETYSLYSFAYSIISMISVTIGAVSTVLFPNIKRISIKNAVEEYPNYMRRISVVAFGLMTGYYPLVFIIRNFLAEYTDSINYLQVIFPGLVLTCCINIVVFTYYKVLGKLKIYLNISLIVLVGSLILNLVGYFCWQSPISFSIASIITLLAWYLLAEQYIIRNYRIRWIDNVKYILVMMLWFYIVSNFVKNIFSGVVIYFIGYLLIALIYARNDIEEIIEKCLRILSKFKNIKHK